MILLLYKYKFNRINYFLNRSAKDIDTVAKTILHVVNSNVLSASNFIAGISEIFEFGPDLYIDIPMLYVYLSKFMTPLIENKVRTIYIVNNVLQNTPKKMFP